MKPWLRQIAKNGGTYSNRISVCHNFGYGVYSIYADNTKFSHTFSNKTFSDIYSTEVDADKEFIIKEHYKEKHIVKFLSESESNFL